MRTLILTLVVLSQLTIGQVTVKEDSLFSLSLNSTSKYTVILPNGYDKNQERYPVLYLLHGLGGNHTNWVTLTKLTAYAAAYHIIIICPDGQNGWYTNSTLRKNARYEDLIIKDVVPDAETKYRVIRTRYYRGIAGLSMGGYGAIKLGLKYPAMFCFAAGLSPSVQFPNGLQDSLIVARWSRTSTTNLQELFGSQRNETWNNDDIFYLIERANAAVTPFLYLSVGSQDGIIELPVLTHQMAQSLRTKQIPFEMHELPGGHDWKLWDAEIRTVLQRFSETLGK